jgi:hypothetical protein
MYRNSVDAFSHLLNGLDDEGMMLEDQDISNISSAIRNLENGMRHCCVQVLFKSGVEYRIDAFGDKADELHLRARTDPMFSLVAV